MKIKEVSVKPIIYVDLDGVLVDLFNHIGVLTDVDHYNNLTKAEWDTFFKTTDAFELFAKAPMFANANQILNMIKTMFGKFSILSSPLEFSKDESIKGKKKWISTHLTVPASKYIFEHEKQKYAVQSNGTPNVLIDDYRKNIQSWENSGGIGIKFQNDEDSLLYLKSSLDKIKLIFDKY